MPLHTCITYILYLCYIYMYIYSTIRKWTNNCKIAHFPRTSFFCLLSFVNISVCNVGAFSHLQMVGCDLFWGLGVGLREAGNAIIKEKHLPSVCLVHGACFDCFCLHMLVVLGVVLGIFGVCHTCPGSYIHYMPWTMIHGTWSNTPRLCEIKGLGLREHSRKMRQTGTIW